MPKPPPSALRPGRISWWPEAPYLTAMAASKRILKRCARPVAERLTLGFRENQKAGKNRLLRSRRKTASSDTQCRGLNLRQGLDTLGAQILAHQFAILIHADLLNVRQIFAPSRPH